MLASNGKISHITYDDNNWILMSHRDTKVRNRADIYRNFDVQFLNSLPMLRSWNVPLNLRRIYLYF